MSLSRELKLHGTLALISEMYQVKMDWYVGYGLFALAATLLGWLLPSVPNAASSPPCRARGSSPVSSS